MNQHTVTNHPTLVNFEQHLIQQALTHSSTQPQDIIKQCYQAAYGAEHLLSDLSRAHAYLEQEFSCVTASPEIPLYERISPQVCRVNLAAWKQRALPLAWLFRMFAASASVSADRDRAMQQFSAYLDTADALIQKNRLPVSFSIEVWTNALSTYKNSGMTAVHHSAPYRQAEHPAYRILRYEYVRLLPILEAVADYFKTVPQPGSFLTCGDPSAPCIIAIDGRAASGKSTMADHLVKILDADVIHMDDFFLPPALRTPERLQTPGGNVHYERFAEEVLSHLHDREAFSYRRFDCHIMDYHGEQQLRACYYQPDQSDSDTKETIVASYPIRIVEGSYSCHPALGDYADITVFSDVDPETQYQRILRRNGEAMAQTFASRWIPMEESYIKEYRIDTSSHMTIDSTNLF